MVALGARQRRVERRQGGTWRRDRSHLDHFSLGVVPGSWADSGDSGRGEGPESPSREIAADLTSGVSVKELYQLFPKGPAKVAARIAGIPKPRGCI